MELEFVYLVCLFVYHVPTNINLNTQILTAKLGQKIWAYFEHTSINTIISTLGNQQKVWLEFIKLRVESTFKSYILKLRFYTYAKKWELFSIQAFQYFIWYF